MSDAPKDGGPAFPALVRNPDPDPMLTTFLPHAGMSLRDWFAGQALVALKGTNPNLPDSAASVSTWPTPEELAHRQARYSYLVADAMLAARTQPQGER